MTRQDGPFGVQPEQRGHEILAPLRLAGMEGRIKGVLDERMLLFERRDGKGLRIELDSIQRVRHHHVPITPPGITWLGVITIILAARVLSGSIQLYALAVGAITIFTWLIGFNIINTSNRLVYNIVDILYRLSEPSLRFVRRFVPSIGNIDISPVIVLILLWFLQNLLIEYWPRQ